MTYSHGTVLEVLAHLKRLCVHIKIFTGNFVLGNVGNGNNMFGKFNDSL